MHNDTHDTTTHTTHDKGNTMHDDTTHNEPTTRDTTHDAYNATTTNGPTCHVFVYGTLMHGEGNWSWALNRPRVCVARLRGVSLHALRSFPCAVPDVSGFTWGEVFEINACDLRTLDELEGIASGLYRRVRVVVDVPGSAPLRAFAYVMDAAPTWAVRMPSGRWTHDAGRALWIAHDAAQRNARRHDTHDDDTHDDATCNVPNWWNARDDELCDGVCVACDSETCEFIEWQDDDTTPHDTTHDDACDAYLDALHDGTRNDDAPTCPVCDDATVQGWGDTCATCRATLRNAARVGA